MGTFVLVTFMVAAAFYGGMTAQAVYHQEWIPQFQMKTTDKIAIVPLGIVMLCLLYWIVRGMFV